MLTKDGNMISGKVIYKLKGALWTANGLIIITRKLVKLTIFSKINCPNLIACDISSVQAFIGDTFTEALYMENALMQQPSHIVTA